MRKRINLVLLLLFLVLWALVGYKFYGMFFPGPNKFAVAERPQSLSNMVLPEKDTFLLAPIERNPFKSDAYTERPQPVLKPFGNLPVTRSAPKVTTPVEFPNIEYYGYIKSGTSESQLVLVKIGSKLHKLKPGQVRDNITIVRATPDSVTVSYMKQRRNFRRN